MARLVDDDDELPDLNVLLGRHHANGQIKTLRPSTSTSPKKQDSSSASLPTKRRVRRLGSGNQGAANPLLRSWSARDEDATNIARKGRSSKPRPLSREQLSDADPLEAPRSRVASMDAHRSRRPGIESRLDDNKAQEESQDNGTAAVQGRGLRNRRQHGSKATVESPTDASEDEIRPADSKPTRSRRLTPDQGHQQDVNGDEDEPSLYQTAAEDTSEYDDDGGQSDADSDSDDDGLSASPGKHPAAKLLFPGSRTALPAESKSRIARHDPALLLHPHPQSREAKRGAKIASTRSTHTTSLSESGSNNTSGIPDLADTFSKLQLHLQDFSDEKIKPTRAGRSTTPSLTPPRKTTQKNLVSPRKQARIPDTPHRPSVDAFWCQEFVDDWNEQHSPRKPTRARPPPARTSTKANAKRETKKSFEARKHQLAEDFLRELDSQITHGKIAKLAESTGGVKIVWTKTLNTTAGRANWRRETIRTRHPSGTSAQENIHYKHHASIELAEKVIDDEHRLLNVLAHEFCHLANFMVNGITNNPHGKEFKVWAAKCSEAFDARGIKVTTKHTYEIDFKYVWTCTACGSEYKRHSKSIDPQRHRCGSCKSSLRQTKPVPRGAGAAGKQSEYQVFMKEQMKIVRSENPGSPQKDVMRIIADKWAKRDRSKEATDKTKISSVVGQLVDLTLEE